jgi:hypothetical protein
LGENWKRKGYLRRMSSRTEKGHVVVPRPHPLPRWQQIVDGFLCSGHSGPYKVSEDRTDRRKKEMLLWGTRERHSLIEAVSNILCVIQVISKQGWKNSRKQKKANFIGQLSFKRP